MPAIPRIQEVVLPILRGDSKLSGVTVVTWVPDIDHRDFPMINIRRIGGGRHETRPMDLAVPVVEMSCYSDESLIEAERLYEKALDALYSAVAEQTQTPKGYLHSIRETMGATQFSSLYMDSWRVQGLIQLGLRPPRSN